MSTNPKSLHDAMRRVQAVLHAAKLDIEDYIGNDPSPGGYFSRQAELALVLRGLEDAQATIEWVKETFEHGVRRP